MPSATQHEIDPSRIAGKIEAGLEEMRESMPDADSVTITVSTDEAEYIKNAVERLSALGSTADVFLTKGYVPREDPDEVDWG